MLTSPKLRPSLGFVYPRLISGGICFFDEYGLLNCLGARAAVDEFFRDKPEPVIELATGQAVLVQGLSEAGAGGGRLAASHRVAGPRTAA